MSRLRRAPRARCRRRLLRAAQRSPPEAAAKADVASLKTDKLKTSLTKEIETLAAQREKIGQLAATAAAVVVVPALASAKALQTRCAELKAGEPAALTQQANWAVGAVATLTTLVNAQPAQAKTIMTPPLENVRKKLPNLKWQIEKGDFKASETLASEIFFACAGVTRAVNSFAADFPAYKVERDKAEKPVKQLRAHAQVAQIKAEIGRQAPRAGQGRRPDPARHAQPDRS